MERKKNKKKNLEEEMKMCIHKRSCCTLYNIIHTYICMYIYMFVYVCGRDDGRKGWFGKLWKEQEQMRWGEK